MELGSEQVSAVEVLLMNLGGFLGFLLMPSFPFPAIF